MKSGVSDRLRVLYRRRWIAVSVFLTVFLYAAVSTLRTTPLYEATTQLRIDKESEAATQYHLLRSRAIAWRALESLGLSEAPSDADRRAIAEEDARRARGGWLERVAVALGAPSAIPPASANETGWQSARIDRFLAGLTVVPVPFTRLVDVRYRSADPVFAARAADAMTEAFVAQEQSVGAPATPGARVFLAANNDALVQVIGTAEVPRLPVLPNRLRDLGIGLVAGLLLAIGLAFGFDHIDSRIKSPDDIKDHLGLPFLGLVPAVKRKHLKGPSPLVQRGAPAPFAESLRGLRTAVVFSAAEDGPRSIMVTSTAPCEGKTVIACNLGDMLAQTEQRTIVIDGDMRRPRVHDIFQIAQEPGLSNVLAGTVPLTAAVRQTQNPFLHVLPAGMIPPNPAELLGSPQYLQLLEDLGRTYEWIVIDAPPVMAVTDAAVISGSAGGVVFVVGAEMTPRRNAQIAIEQLVGVRAKLVGAVLNRARVDRHAFYYSQYYRKDYTQAYVRTP